MADDALTRKEAEMGLTFEEWFKREYPLYERDGRDTSLKAALRIAWQTAERQTPFLESVREEALEASIKRYLKELGDEAWWTAGERRLAKALHAPARVADGDLIHQSRAHHAARNALKDRA